MQRSTVATLDNYFFFIGILFSFQDLLKDHMAGLYARILPLDFSCLSLFANASRRMLYCKSSESSTPQSVVASENLKLLLKVILAEPRSFPLVSANIVFE